MQPAAKWLAPDSARHLIPPELSPLLTVNPLNLDMSLVQPRGLYEMSRLLAERYGLPLIITETNGRQPRSELVELYRQVAAERRVPEPLLQAHPIDLDQPPTGGVPDSRIFTQGWPQD